MKAMTPLAILLALASGFVSCQTTDQAVWDEIDARSAAMQPGGAAPAASGSGAAVPSAGNQSPAAAPMQARPVPAGIPTAMAEPLLPRNAAPAPSIAGLEFLTGRWVAINPNKTVNEEVWTPPRGNCLIGSFRQIRLDGDCSFVEMSQISVEGDEILLRLRHLHGRLEVPEGRSEVSVFRLVSLERDRVEFAGITGAKDVESMVYQRMSETELKHSVRFAPETGQEAFDTNYVLDR